VRVGQRSLGDEIVAAVCLSSATAKVMRVTASQLDNKGDVKDGGSNEIIDASF
jgi:hypothetical protein